ncbi:MAG: hypothetical protein HUU01_00065 [Saprospiraceae bacterium]|nr:hypothetical protein [Saprospiraceae bacterium]
MATAFIFLVVALVAIGLVTTVEGNAKRRSEYYEERNKEVIPFDKRNLLPRGYQGRVLAMPAHTQGVYDDAYAAAYTQDRRNRKSNRSGNQRLTATLLFSMLIIITLAYAAMRKKEHTASSPFNKAELYLKY